MFHVEHSRVLSWFSCGAASAVSGKLTLAKYPHALIVNCDTVSSEHPDNARFLTDCEAWYGTKIIRLSSSKYDTVDDVFEKERYMGGPRGAKCTVELKKKPRFEFQRPEDIHVFGFTVEEKKRIRDFDSRNPDMRTEWVLRDAGITKQECYRVLTANDIRLPEMYFLGFKNNNCPGCVKATSPGYWNKVRKEFPEVFARRVKQSRDLGVRLVELHGNRIFLDELPENEHGRFKSEVISCGPECG